VNLSSDEMGVGKIVDNDLVHDLAANFLVPIDYQTNGGTNALLSVYIESNKEPVVKDHFIETVDLEYRQLLSFRVLENLPAVN
jgi:hypothetical protein